MDKTSKKILKMLRKNPDQYFFYYDEPYEALNMSEEEFYRSVRYLASLNLLEFITNQDDIHIGIVASHQAIHRNSIKFDSFKKWFFHTFLGGLITGIITGVISTLLATYLMGLLHI